MSFCSFPRSVLFILTITVGIAVSCSIRFPFARPHGRISIGDSGRYHLILVIHFGRLCVWFGVINIHLSVFRLIFLRRGVMSLLFVSDGHTTSCTSSCARGRFWLATTTSRGPSPCCWLVSDSNVLFGGFCSFWVWRYIFVVLLVSGINFPAHAERCYTACVCLSVWAALCTRVWSTFTTTSSVILLLFLIPALWFSVRFRTSAWFWNSPSVRFTSSFSCEWKENREFSFELKITWLITNLLKAISKL